MASAPKLKPARVIPRALYLPTGVTYNANDIIRDSPEKPGPWACATPNCPVRYTNHRVASYSKEPNAEERVVRSATFVVRGEANHALHCDHNRPEAKKRIAAEHPEVVKVSKTLLFLNISTPSPTHQRAVTRQQTPKKYKDPDNPTVPVVKVPAIDSERYKKVLRAARSLEKLIASYGDDPVALAEHQVRFDGRTFDWAQFAFGPGHDRLITFNTVNEARGTQRLSMRYRPFLLRGYVKSVRTATSGNPCFILHSGEAHAGKNPDGDTAVWIFAPTGSPAGEAITKLKSGTPVTVLSIDDGRLTRIDRPLLNITAASQLFIHL